MCNLNVEVSVCKVYYMNMTLEAEVNGLFCEVVKAARLFCVVIYANKSS